MPEVNPIIKTLEQAVFAGVCRAAAYVSRVSLDVATQYLATRFPTMPADEIARVIDFCKRARQAGKDLTSGVTPDIPIASGVFMATERTYKYDVFQPIVLKDEKRAFGKTDVTAIWGEEP